MKINEYQELAWRTRFREGDDTQKLIGYSLGLSGEAGEVADLIKKFLFHGHDYDHGKMVKELGDVLWYTAAIASSLGKRLVEPTELRVGKFSLESVSEAALRLCREASTWRQNPNRALKVLVIEIAGLALLCDITLEEVMVTNIHKLKKRYPEGFDVERSRNRVE